MIPVGLLPTLPPVAVQILSVVGGFVGGIGTSLIVYFIRRCVRRQKLRRLLKRELEVPEAALERVDDADPESFERSLHSSLPTSVYDANAGKLGLLTEDEFNPLIVYYTNAKVAEEQLKSVEDGEVREQFIEETVPLLRRKRKDALDAIEDRL